MAGVSTLIVGRRERDIGNPAVFEVGGNVCRLHPADEKFEAALQVYEYLTAKAQALHTQWQDLVGSCAYVQLSILQVLWVRLNHLRPSELEGLPRWEANRRNFVAVTDLLDHTAKTSRRPDEREIRAELLNMAMHFTNRPELRERLLRLVAA